MIANFNEYNEEQRCWLIPSAIDLPMLLEKYPPAFKYNIHHFYYLIDTICDKMDFLDVNDEKQWVHLSTVKLQKFKKDYRQYLDYLEKRGIITINPSYRNGEHCKGYKIAPIIIGALQ